jgi:glycosyltransferase involved in cell wall biosynthesis
MGAADIRNLASNVYRRGDNSLGRNGQDRIKIVRIIGRLNVGGPAIHVVNLTAGLCSERYRPLLVAGSENKAEGSMLDFALSNGVKPTVIPEIVTAFSLAPRDGKALWKLYGLMRKERPHIVHTHTAKAGFLGRLAARIAGVPVVVHTFHGHVLHGYYGPVKNAMLRRVEQSLACFTDRVVTVSEQVKNDLIRYRIAWPEKIKVVPLGFDLDPFLTAHTRRGEFRREMGLTGEIKLVGIVGRIFPIKNHALFLQSAAQVSAQNPAARFILVGDGVLRSALEQQAQKLGIADRVLFTGWRQDLPRIYADLDVLVVSSNNEGTPVSAIEAMASGCPVVATRVGGLPDLIEDQMTGRLVPPRAPEALTNAVVDLLHDSQRARELGENGRYLVQHRFTVQRLLSDMDELYTQLLAEKAISFRAPEELVVRR